MKGGRGVFENLLSVGVTEGSLLGTTVGSVLGLALGEVDGVSVGAQKHFQGWKVARFFLDLLLPL